MKPEKMTDEQIAALLSKHYMYESEKVRAIEAARDKQWEVLIPKIVEAYGGDLANVPAQKEQP